MPPPMLEAGVAVLIYDKAGHGRSAAPSPRSSTRPMPARRRWRSSPPGRRSTRRASAWRGSPTGCGRSPWSPRAVGLRSSPALARPGCRWLSRRCTAGRRCSGSPASDPHTLAAAADAWRCLFAIVADGPDRGRHRVSRAGAGHAPHRRDLIATRSPDYVRENPMLSPIPPLIPVADLVAMVASERDAEVAHDPAADYARIGCPVLLQYGADDTSVPVEASRDAVLAAAPRPTSASIPGWSTCSTCSRAVSPACLRRASCTSTTSSASARVCGPSSPTGCAPP